jgi:aminoglycoside/choline kinase family phosphotransferase
MCSADATPVRLQWRKESHYLIAKFDGYHTCRNFDLLHDWSKERALENHQEEAQRLIDEQVAEGTL